MFDPHGRFLTESLDALVRSVGPDKLVIDLSCRRTGDGWAVAMNRWQTLTDLHITPATLDRLAPHCAEFLIHAADVEGLCRGIDADLVALLGAWGKIPVTYAGGAATMDDVRLVETVGQGKVDVTVGSALDLFGGAGLCYRDLVAWNRRYDESLQETAYLLRSPTNARRLFDAIEAVEKGNLIKPEIDLDQ